MIRELLQTIGQLFTWLVIVAPWEQALRIRCGKHVHRLTAGVYLRIPFIDRVYRQPTRRRVSVIRPQTLTTRDGCSVTLTASFGYTISNLELLYRTLHDAHDTIEMEVAGRIAEHVSDVKLADVSVSSIVTHLASHIDLTRYGLTSQEFNVVSFVVAKTYRLITGDFPSWNHGGGLNTDRYDGERREL